MDRKRIIEVVESHHQAVAYEILEAVCKAHGYESKDHSAAIPLKDLATVLPEICNNFSSAMLVEVLSDLLADD